MNSMDVLMEGYMDCDECTCVSRMNLPLGD